MMQNVDSNPSAVSTLSGSIVSVVPGIETSVGSATKSPYAVLSIDAGSSIQDSPITLEPDTVYASHSEVMNSINLSSEAQNVPSPVAMTTATTTPGGPPLRAPSPSPSEASTGSSNNSLDLMRLNKCSMESCTEVLPVSGKRRKGPLMCNYHRNKTYKAKKRQKDQMATSFQMMKKKHEDSLPKPPNLQAILSVEQPIVSDGLPRLDQVLNEKKLALLRSPAIVQFLKESQQQLSHSHLQEIKPEPQTPTPNRTITPGRHTAAS